MNQLRVIPHPVLAERTTMGLGGPALAELRLLGPDGLDAVARQLEESGGRLEVLGQGSNILASDKELPVVLLTKTAWAEPMICGETDGKVLVAVDAGTKLPVLLAFLAQNGLSGLEGLSGIPGSVGGALRMNAGSYGTEIGRHVSEMQIFSPSLGLAVLPRDRCIFGYRTCAVADHDAWFIILGATLALDKGKEKTVRQAMRETMEKKQATQPVTARSAGCVFKNPAGESAGRLLDKAGLRGFRQGGMAFSALHANFLVHEGGGSFAAAMDMIALARERVMAAFGVHLELEVRVWE